MQNRSTTIGSASSCISSYPHRTSRHTPHLRAYYRECIYPVAVIDAQLHPVPSSPHYLHSTNSSSAYRVGLPFLEYITTALSLKSFLLLMVSGMALGLLYGILMLPEWNEISLESNRYLRLGFWAGEALCLK